jgi:hypothetical protein
MQIGDSSYVDMNNCNCGVPLDGRPPCGRESDLACCELHKRTGGPQCEEPWQLGSYLELE